jgi:alpha-L-fucosidase
MKKIEKGITRRGFLRNSTVAGACLSHASLWNSALAATPLAAQVPPAAQAPAVPMPKVPTLSGPDVQARLAWWREARFGLFMHWGLYSIPGRGEWVQWKEQIPVNEYAKLAGQFDAQSFDPDSWAAIAKSAGMKYTVLTARHHDGFALFNDLGSDFTAMQSAAHRDFVADYVKAIRNAGLRVGLYYSPLDWRFPGFFFPDLYQPNADLMRDQYHRQLNQLASNYGPLDILWFDGGETSWLGFGGVNFTNGAWRGRPAGQHYAGSFSWGHDEAIAELRRLQPSVIINNRTDAPAEFVSREGDRAMGGFDNQQPWELCTTLVDGPWGYQPEAPVKSLAYCIHLLVGAAGRDGNLLLNVGPMPNGQIDPAHAQRLAEIGDWLRQYGQSIYGTGGGPYMPGDFGVSTYRDKTVYVHILSAVGATLALPALPAKIVDCKCLTGGSAACKQTNDGVTVTLSGNADAADTIVALTLDSPAADIKPIATAMAAPKATAS